MFATSKLEVDSSQVVSWHTTRKIIPSYHNKPAWEKYLKGHVVTMVILCMVFVDVLSVAADLMIGNVCKYRGEREISDVV